MKVKCNDVWYEDSEPNHKWKTTAINSGMGWNEFGAPSRLILEVELHGRKKEIWIDSFFKNRLGPLTAKRIQSIKDAMPTEIDVSEQTGRRGTRFLAVENYELEDWLKRIAGQ